MGGIFLMLGLILGQPYAIVGDYYDDLNSCLAARDQIVQELNETYTPEQMATIQTVCVQVKEA